jgi:hypothetical protein
MPATSRAAVQCDAVRKTCGAISDPEQMILYSCLVGLK